MSRYDPLRWYLARTATDQAEVRLTFQDIDKIVGSLPGSARSYRPWWANSSRSPQALAWQAAGFVVDQVNLTAEHVVFTRGQAQRRVLTTVVMTGTTGPDQGGTAAVRTGQREADHTEASVQARLIGYLTGEGWHIEKTANTATREPGIDVIASKGRRWLAVEVKGFPSRSYADPRKADQIKPTNPLTQARHWYASAMLQAMFARQKHPTYEIAVAFPDVPTYRSLYERTRVSLTDLRVTCYFVATDGEVTIAANP